jgi:oligoribonuclease NrnB/cAMP/cGMP phosphodiesterase (DHH superfamily)
MSDIQFVNGKVPWKVLQISHDDLDGAGAAIVVQTVFSNVTTQYVNYHAKLEGWIKSIENNPFVLNKYDLLILTDIALRPDQLRRIFVTLSVADFKGKFILLDHHESSKQFHNPKANIHVMDSICGAKLTLVFLENMFNIMLPHLYELINLVDDYDLWHHKSYKSKHLQYILEYYMNIDKENGIQTFVNRFMDGIQWDQLLDVERKSIARKEQAIEDVWNSLDVTLYNGSKIAIIFVSSNIKNEISQRILDSADTGVEVVINFSADSTAGSVRATDRKVKDINVSKVIEFLSNNTKVLSGGGHKLASGFVVKGCTYSQSREERFKIVQPALDLLCKSLIATYPELK